MVRQAHVRDPAAGQVSQQLDLAHGHGSVSLNILSGNELLLLMHLWSSLSDLRSVRVVRIDLMVLQTVDDDVVEGSVLAAGDEQQKSRGVEDDDDEQ